MQKDVFDHNFWTKHLDDDDLSYILIQLAAYVMDRSAAI